MDVFSGPLGRECEGKWFLRKVFEISRKDTQRHFPEELNPHAANVLKVQFKQYTAYTGGTERANWTV